MRIATEPPGARIYRNGELMDSSPVTLTDLPPGTHLITAGMPGYHEARATIVLERGQRLPLDLTLRPITGLVLIHSTPTGVDITINGAYRGRAPLLLTDLPLGRHRAAASHPGYLPMELDIVVENRTPQKLALEMRPDSSQLSFTSVPTGAQVYIDGILRGTTPCFVERVPSGERLIEIQIEGHRPFRQRLQLQAGDTLRIQEQLEPLPGSLRLTSIPEGARIYVRNAPRGQTPLQLDDLTPGPYDVRAEAPGYAPETANLIVRHAGLTAHEFRLQRDSGIIVLTTEPALVRVLIDGQEAGETPAGETDVLSQVLTIDPVARGTRTVQLSRPGYFPTEFQVEIEAGKTVTRHERLQRRFIPDTRIRIGDGPGDQETGIISQRFPNGDIEIEVRPGIFRTIERHRIRSVEPLTVRPQEE